MCSLHLTHPRAHTPGAVGSRRTWEQFGFGTLLKGLTSVVVLKVERTPEPNHSPHRQFLPEPRFEPATSGYKSDALSIRPRLPHWITFKWYFLLEPESLSVFRFPHRSVVLRSSTDQINPTTWHWPPDWWSAGGSKRSKVAVAPSCMGRYLRRPNGWGELTRPNFP